MTTEHAISTQNKKGFTYPLTSYGRDFIAYSATAQHPVLDIGAAFGVATIAALEAGAKVIAVDIEWQHLHSLQKNAPQEHQSRLLTKQGRFPDIDFPKNSFSAIYISQVLPFLTGEEIEKGVEKLYSWLVPGGKVFVVSFTPYLKHCQSFIPVYEQRRQEGKKWAGYIENLSLYCSDSHMLANLPNQIHHVDAVDMDRVFREANFMIEKLEIFGDEEGLLPEGIRLDNRERVGIIATKPSL